MAAVAGRVVEQAGQQAGQVGERADRAERAERVRKGGERLGYKKGARTLPDRGRAGAAFCGVAHAALLLGDVWTLLLIRDLANGPRRFSELETSTGISPRVLSDRLRELCARGVMSRRMYPEIPPRVEYSLTEKGRAALPIIDALRVYGEQWLSAATETYARVEARSRATGAVP